MSEWIESSMGIKFLCWGELKESIENPDDAVVVKIGGKIQGIIQSIDEQKDKEDNVTAYKMKIKTKEHDVPVLIWSNASLFRQIEEIGIAVGNEVQMIYQKDYPAKGGKIGRDIKLRVKK